MAAIKIPDAAGETVTAYDLGAYRICCYPLPLEGLVDTHARFPHFQFRDGDIVIASYAKTGCTWLNEIISMLLHGGPDATITNKMFAMMDAVPAETLDAMTSPRLLNTHAPYARLPDSIREKNVKVVLVVRNPKDAAVSLYNMMTSMKLFQYDGKFENWLPAHLHGKFVYEPYYKYIKDWEAAYESGKHEIVLLHYEDMKEDTLREVKKLSKFLEIPLAVGMLTEIAEACQFKAMRSRYKEDEFGNISYKTGKPGFFRKGEVGDWKNWFTVAMSEDFDRVYRQQLKTSNIKFRYAL